MIQILSIALLVSLLIAIIINARWITGELRPLIRNNKALLFGWTTMFAGIGVFSHRAHSAVGVTTLDESSKFQLIYMIIGGLIALALLFSTSAFARLFRAPLVYLTLYGIFGVITSIFSPTPMLSAYKATLVIIDASLIATAITYSLRDREIGIRLVNITYLLVGLFVVGSIFGVIIYPSLALLPSHGLLNVIMAGTIPHMNPNELGFLAAVVSVVTFRRTLFTKRIGRKLLWLTILLCCLFVVFMAQSRTAVAALFISIVFILFSIPKYRIVSFVTAICLSLSVLSMATFSNITEVGVIDEGMEYLQRGQEHGGLRTIIGRSSTWANIGLPMFYASPLIGHGFDAGVRYGGAEYGIGKTHMHNTYVQILANSGLAGMIPWILMFIGVLLMAKKQLFRYHWPIKNENDLFYLEITSVLIIIVLRSATGSVLVNHSWSLMVFLSIMAFLVISRTRPVMRSSKKHGMVATSTKIN